METEDFEWDERKCRRNVQKHGIDFEEVVEMFHGPYITRRSDRKEEERWLAIGEAEGRIVAVVFTRRSGRIRIISARRARTDEARTYRRETMGTAKKGKN